MDLQEDPESDQVPESDKLGEEKRIKEAEALLFPENPQGPDEGLDEAENPFSGFERHPHPYDESVFALRDAEKDRLDIAKALRELSKVVAKAGKN